MKQIIISKHDNHFVVTTLADIRIFDRFLDAADFILQYLDNPQLSKDDIPLWVKDVIEEG